MKRLLCRAAQATMRLASYALPWRAPEIIRGDRPLEALARRIQSDGIANVLLVIGPNIRKKGLARPLLEALAARGVAVYVYDGVVPNPTLQNAEDAARVYRENGCRAIVAFGGGSPMDCAKLAGALVARPGRTLRQMRGFLGVRAPLPPLYAIPTTAGSGSETTLAAVVSDPATHEKYALSDPALIPTVAVLDPTLTLGLPPALTATTGMDALCHAVEAYIGRANTRRTEREALEAVRLIFAALPRAYRDGGNLEARDHMLLASHKAGVAFTRAYVGYVHAMAHAVGGVYGVAHGLANAVLLPFVLRAYGDRVARRLANLADAAGVAKPNQSVGEKAAAFVAAIEALNRQMNIPAHLAQIREEDIPCLARRAAREGNVPYPAPRVLLAPELEQIYRLARGNEAEA